MPKTRPRNPRAPLDPDCPTDAKLDELEAEAIHPLGAASGRFPRARYHCRACDYHCDSVAKSWQHARDQRHRLRSDTAQLGRLAGHLPEPTSAHASALGAQLAALAGSVALDAAEAARRRQVAEAAAAAVRQAGTAPGAIAADLCGSLTSGLATARSDVNICLVLDLRQCPEAFDRCVDALRRVGQFAGGIQTDLATPAIVCRDCEGVIYRFTCAGSSARASVACLIGAYASLRRRCRRLCLALRNVAARARLDSPDRWGTLPTHAYDLMVVHYLQVTGHLPLLNCLAETAPPEMPRVEGVGEDGVRVVYLDGSLDGLWQRPRGFSGCEGLGRQWLGLLRYYGLPGRESAVVSVTRAAPLTCADKDWPPRPINIEDPFQTRCNLSRSAATIELLDYIVMQLRAALAYFAVPRTACGPVYCRMRLTSAAADSTAAADDRCSVIRVVNKADEEEAERRRRQADEDARLPEQTEAKAAVDGDAEDVIYDAGERCEASEANEVGKEDAAELNDANVPVGTTQPAKAVNGAACADVGEDGYERSIEGEPDDTVELEKSSVPNQAEPSAATTNGGVKLASRVLDSPEHGYYSRALVESVPESEMHFEAFDIDAGIGGGQCTLPIDPPLKCLSCRGVGHMKDTCDKYNLPKPEFLSPPQAQLNRLHWLDQTLMSLPSELAATPSEEGQRERLRLEILALLRIHLAGATCSLELFGSCCNGFAFRDSDLDMCLTFPAFASVSALPTPAPDLINKVAAILKGAPGPYMYDCVLPVHTAKVPIVKFKHRRYDMDGDLSLYNLLGVHNTRLMLTYAALDQRVRPLGYAAKLLAKQCNIGDASRGSLSSYAYLILLISFLQREGVLPCLQELHGPGDRPELLVDGWNAWFQGDAAELKRLWCCGNRKGTAELWLGFLHHCLVFNWSGSVVTIRRSRPLPRQEKLWTSPLAIEDPFDLNHNLASGMTKKMAWFILTTIGNALARAVGHGRSHHQRPFISGDLCPPDEPRDRGCQRCGRIGHAGRDCGRDQEEADRLAPVVTPLDKFVQQLAIVDREADRLAPVMTPLDKLVQQLAIVNRETVSQPQPRPQPPHQPRQPQPQHNQPQYQPRQPQHNQPQHQPQYQPQRQQHQPQHQQHQPQRQQHHTPIQLQQPPFQPQQHQYRLPLPMMPQPMPFQFPAPQLPGYFNYQVGQQPAGQWWNNQGLPWGYRPPPH